MSPLEIIAAGARDVFDEFDIEPADLTYLRSVEETLTPDIREWVMAQWQAEVEAQPWFEALHLKSRQVAAITQTMDGYLARLLSGERIEELYGDMERAASVALRHGVRNTDLFQASTKLEAVLAGVVLQLFPSSDQQTIALVTLTKFLKSLLYVVMETYRREAANELEGRNRELASALEQQTASAEVLHAISASPGDLVPVFDAMLEKVRRLCEANFAVMNRYDGERFLPLAIYGVPASFEQQLLSHPPQPGPRNALSRLARGEEAVRIDDLRKAPAYRSGDPRARAIIELGGGRSYVVVALRKDGRLLGTLAAYRQDVRPFSDKHVALLQNFAAQAVIAMENARLITETQEALEQQTATAEVLGVINASPGNLTPVFDEMVDKALRLCEAAYGALAIFQEDRYRAASTRGIPAKLVDFVRQEVTIFPGSPPDRICRGEESVHIADIRDFAKDVPSPGLHAMIELGDARTSLWVALRKDGVPLGFFAIYRTEVRPFTDKQVALVQNFAAQAVIAMENARLLDEIRQRQAELRVTFDNMGDGVAMFDGEMRLAAWNLNFQKILDLPDEFVARRPSLQEYFQYMEARGEYGTAAPEIEAEIRHGVTIAERESRFERTRPDGRVIEVRRNAVPGGGSVLIFSDVTERKRSEAEIHAARDAAEGALRELKTAQASLIQAEKMASLGQLTAGIAHEIKNPLNFVNNFASLSLELLDELKEVAEPALAALDSEKRDELDETIGMLTGNLEKITEHGRRADNIVKSMLEHSRGVSGERREVDLNALVEESLNLAYHGARAMDQSFNITLERDLDHDLRPIGLVPQDMTRVFLNLFGNGFYAANKRAKQADEASYRPVLQVATREAGDAVEVRVRDNGIGIPLDIRDKLFQPFFTTKPTGEGTGLGLSITYDIVTQQHGGTIAVDSEVGEFTEFTVRLPRQQQMRN